MAPTECANADAHDRHRLVHHRGRSGRRPAGDGPQRAADRHGARSAGADGEGVRRAGGDRRADGWPARRAGHRRRRPGGVRRDLRPARRRCTGSPGRWPNGCRRPAGCSPSPTTATPRTSGPASRSGAELRDRIAALPGFGAQKAAIFTALLGKQYGVTPAGWREAAGAYGEPGSHRSVADVVDPDSLEQVRATKKAAKAAAKAARRRQVIRRGHQCPQLRPDVSTETCPIAGSPTLRCHARARSGVAA